MPSHPAFASPTSPPYNRYRDHSPTKSSPLRHAVSTRSAHSESENSSLPSRQGTTSSNASSAYSTGGYSGYDSASDPFVSRNAQTNQGLKRDRSESPVKKNAAFAKWEARERDEQESRGQPEKSSRPLATSMKGDTSPTKVREHDWRGSIGLGRSESRSGLRDIEPNAAPTTPGHTRSAKSDLQLDSKQTITNSGARSGDKTSHARARSHGDVANLKSPESLLQKSPGSSAQKNSFATLSRSDSIRSPTKSRREGHVRFNSTDSPSLQVNDEDLATFAKSSTSYLRTLGNLQEENINEDLSVHSPEEQVAGLAGRRRLQRSGSVRPSKSNQSQFASQFASTQWMDKQRRYLQAYEYLCHIGEARAWLEDVLEPDQLPPIVQLEEALRDGVTLAKVVVRLSDRFSPPEQRQLGSLRIFTSPRLQFRHSDNIAMFFRFLAVIELPELFRFELVDLYEKKNIPKVIYCIHALSWLLFRKGVVDFRIGNLVGQLQFEDHELEEAQKGIDRSGVAMPNFGGMREAMQVEEEEPPSAPEPTPEELLQNEEEVILDLQSQVRGMIVRARLGDMMNDLWDVEGRIAELQAMIRGDFSRGIFSFRFAMQNSNTKFQAAAKAFLVRQRQLQRHYTWTSNAHAVTKLQNIWRGRQQRAETKTIKTQIRSHQHGIKGLQAAIRGTLGRWRAGDLWNEVQDAGDGIVPIQATMRGALQRLKINATMNQLWDKEEIFSHLQSFIRGGQVRRKHKTQTTEASQATSDVVQLQALARGLIQRKELGRQHGTFTIHEHSITEAQAACRGLLERLQQARFQGALHSKETMIVKLQSALRAYGKRQVINQQQAQLERSQPVLSKLQAFARASITRQHTEQLRLDLAQHSQQICELQSLSRAMLERSRIGNELATLEDAEPSTTDFQSIARAYLERQRVFEILVATEKQEETVVQMQAFARAMLSRSHVGNTLAELDECEEDIVELQTAARAFTIRANFMEKQRHYNENMQRVIKLQSFVRAKQQGESYKSLVSGKNPPLPVVRKHLHLLTDSSLEFEGELEAERLRRQVVESVRRNELVEGYVEGLDVKIALLVKNKITLDEVVKHQRHFGGSASQLLRNGSTLHSGNGVDLKALNKSSRKKLGSYEELFFTLQTQPQYLARLFQQASIMSLADKEGRNLERLIMTIFGYAQKSREEYYLIKLLATSARMSVERSQSLDDCMRQQSSCFHQRLLLGYVRSPRDRAYFKIQMGSMVRDGIVGQEHLDLESDPLQIYRAILNNEELSTGIPSNRPRDLPREVVIRQDDVRPRYVEHLQDLRDLCDGFFLGLEECAHRMPFGIRYLASEQYQTLSQRFSQEDPAHLAMLVGAWLWKSYILPALREPEMWGVIDRGLSAHHRRNLSQVVVVLGQVVAGRKFGPDNLYLQPLNNWITESLGRWQHCLHEIMDIAPAEQHYDADQWSDLYARTKPTLYIKLTDIFAIHTAITENIAAVAPARDDPLKDLLIDLGTAKGNETDIGNGGSSGGEITLTLKSRFTVQEDPDAQWRQLFTATKRLVLYIIKVQSGSNLMDILLRPFTDEDADRWVDVLREDAAEKKASSHRNHNHNASSRQSQLRSQFDPRASFRSGRAQSVYSEIAPSTAASFDDRRNNDLLDLENLTYSELKSNALENILLLEQPQVPPSYRVTRGNNYQELLNALASDIRQKHRRRLERARELDATSATLAQLDSKAGFLEEQLKSYNDYIEQSLHTLASKKASGKSHKFTLPFTKQWSHEREMKIAGRRPKFGSYKYSARQLSDKGVLISWPAFPQELWSNVDFVISSDEVGVFHIEASEGSCMVTGASANLLLDDLLQAQYDGRQAVGVFEGRDAAKLAVNLFLHLVFKKFYREE
ncbi:ras GTPase [Polychaeton citri CBS 116435]|uniref:Ras GTPase n=1 Tax=Polychaeton citri CBS 116435 TaxID=1314669 RepID=A0A9P4Q5D7_9PEZI|nr:ras GTPase [Polychaeton citri CBS 116435]